MANTQPNSTGPDPAPAPAPSPPKEISPVDLGFSQTITHQKPHGAERPARPAWVQEHRPFWLGPKDPEPETTEAVEPPPEPQKAPETTHPTGGPALP